MKIRTLLFIITLLLIQIAHSQDKKFGLIGGLNYADVVGDVKNRGNIDNSGRIGFCLGGLSFFSLSENFNFSPRLIYSSQGYNSDFDSFIFDIESSGIYETSNRFNYLNAPLIFQFSPAEKLSLNLGPQFGFLMNVKSVTKQDGEEINRSSGSGDFRFDYGVTGGISYRIKSDFLMEIAYYRGFSNDVLGQIGNIKNNNSVFSLSVGYLLF